MSYGHIEMARVAVIAASGEKFVVCQYLRITPATRLNDSVGNRIQPYWKTACGLDVFRESEGEFRVKRGPQWMEVRPVDQPVETTSTI